MISIRVPDPIEWAEEELAWLDAKTAGRVGPSLTFARFLGIFLFNFKGTMDYVQACIRFQAAAHEQDPGTVVQVKESDHHQVAEVAAKQQFHFEILKKIMPHLEAITEPVTPE